MNIDEIAQVAGTEVVKAQPTLFDGQRQTMTEAIQLTTDSLSVYAAR
jgi:hypothetical protein